MPRLVAAPDKFRGTATAREAAVAIAAGGHRLGWDAEVCPMSDGGEGFCDAMVAASGGEVRESVVTGPLGDRVAATWALRDDGTAVLEAATAAGRALVPHPAGNDPLDASTAGVGELIAAALAAGATSLLVGCGGTATTDGGAGCLHALDDLHVRVDVPLTVACDVGTRFTGAAAEFAPQMGASAAQVARLEARLAATAAAYRDRFDVDVTGVAGSGAAGGLAGLLVALGGTVIPGARLVADAAGLEDALHGADLVVTGEGRLDQGTLRGKVVRFVLELDLARPALVVAGAADEEAFEVLTAARSGPTSLTTLDPVGQRKLGTTAAIEAAVRIALSHPGRHGST